MPKEQATQLEQAADAFFLDCEIRQLAPATLTWYRKYVGALLTWLEARAVTTAAGITLDLLRDVGAQLQDKDLSPNAVHHHAAAAKVFCDFRLAEGLTTDRTPGP